MASFVCIHGAWGGAWTWGDIPARLRALGHAVLCPDLPGMGERVDEKHPGITLGDHVADVCAQIAAAGFDRFILAGHSYGGMVITGVASRLGARIDAIAYLDAFLPHDGQSLWDVTGSHEHDWYVGSQKHTPGLVAPIFGEEMLALPGFSRQPLLTLVEAAERGAAWDVIPRKCYVFASAWSPSPFPRFAAEVKGDPAWDYHELACSHALMTDLPDETLAILSSLA